jgi:hypothetical protein
MFRLLLESILHEFDHYLAISLMQATNVLMEYMKQEMVHAKYLLMKAVAFSSVTLNTQNWTIITNVIHSIITAVG